MKVYSKLHPGINITTKNKVDGLTMFDPSFSTHKLDL